MCVYSGAPWQYNRSNEKQSAWITVNETVFWQNVTHQIKWFQMNKSSTGQEVTCLGESRKQQEGKHTHSKHTNTQTLHLIVGPVWLIQRQRSSPNCPATEMFPNSCKAPWGSLNATCISKELDGVQPDIFSCCVQLNAGAKINTRQAQLRVKLDSNYKTWTQPLDNHLPSVVFLGCLLFFFLQDFMWRHTVGFKSLRPHRKVMERFWGKLHLKVMHYNIVLLPKKNN